MTDNALAPYPAKVVSVRSRDNLANRMIQFIAARALVEKIGGSILTGVHLPEWNIPYIENPDPGGFAQIVRITSSNPRDMNIQELSDLANNAPSINIILEDYMLRMAHFNPRWSYADSFPEPAAIEFDDDELLINIRAGDILIGVGHYPVLPVKYYRWLAEITGLRPVFGGQLDESRYVSLIRQEFPDARFIETRGPVGDFQLVRSARNIAVGVSTFSWLAAWLSRARTIFLPLCGFLSPVYMREVDLLPTPDPRYRFIQFPHFFGIEEAAMLEHHVRIENTWKEVSPRQVALLRDRSPFLAPRTADIPFEPVWYTHTYIDAAKDISEGWFQDPLHHYLEVGKLRGHAATRVELRPETAALPGENLARLGHATQSSVSVWSQQSTIEADAATAINGRVWEDKFFCTDFDPSPWWRVDLRTVCSVSQIRIFNRDGPDVIQRRASPLTVEASLDGQQWSILFQTDPELLIGGRSGRPLIWTSPEPVRTRFVRVVLPRQEFLHLAEVEIYGTEFHGTGPEAPAIIIEGRDPC